MFGMTIEDLREVNIFYLDHNPAIAAESHCDRHVVKMIVETAQLLSTAWHVLAADAVSQSIGSTDPAYISTYSRVKEKEARLAPGLIFYLGNQRIYGCTHEHHPSAKWARETTGNYDWLWRMGMGLLFEYTHRYGKRHATTDVMRTLELPPPDAPDAPQSEPPLAMAEEFYVADAAGYADAVASYRRYYRDGKRHLLTYTRRPPPAWACDIARHKEVLSK